MCEKQDDQEKCYPAYTNNCRSKDNEFCRSLAKKEITEQGLQGNNYRKYHKKDNKKRRAEQRNKRLPPDRKSNHKKYRKKTGEQTADGKTGID